MSSLGVSRLTGRPLSDFEHTLQSIEVILTTGIGDLLIREWFGFPGVRLLGENLTASTVIRFFQCVVMALSMRQLNGLPAEPRFRVVKVVPLGADRQGNFSFRIEGEYMPRGHLGDTTVEGARSAILSRASGSLLVAAA